MPELLVAAAEMAKVTDQSHVIGGGVGDENSDDGKEPTSPEMPDPMEVIVIAAAVILFCFLV